MASAYRIDVTCSNTDGGTTPNRDVAQTVKSPMAIERFPHLNPLLRAFCTCSGSMQPKNGCFFS